MRCSSFIMLALAVALSSCGSESDPLGSRALPVIYGDDDRVEIAALPETDPVRIAATASVAALVPSDQLQIEEQQVELFGSSWAEERELCDDVRFGEQPVLAHCSAVLIADDLLLSAGHCARLQSSVRVVFGLHYDADGALPALASADVYDVIDVVVDQQRESGVDFAWLRLDRKVTGRAPAPVRPSDPEPGESLVLVSFPAGVPMKADGGGSVVAIGEGVLRTTHDAFEASSGGPLFDALGRVVGVLGGGAPDLVTTASGCHEPLVLDENAGGLERATLAGTALHALCERAPHEAICGDADAGAATCAYRRVSRAQPRCWIVVLLLSIMLGFRRSAVRLTKRDPSL